MNKIYILIAIAFFTCSCSDFLNREPENSVSSENFLSTEADLRLYTNGLLQKMLPDAEEIAWGGDQYADCVATRTSTEFLIGSSWNADQQGGWSSGNNGTWAQLRQINYMLDHMERSKGNISNELYKHYEGVGRFWRAYFYYKMVRTFGDVPWYEHEIDVNDDALLYKPRDSREYVMERVLEDLTFAATYCSASDATVKSSTLISKWVALAFKSRVCLFEGTYRKYHSELGLTASVTKYLNEAVAAASELLDKSPYKLLQQGAPTTQYRSLFISEKLQSTEVIWGVEYKKDVRMHSNTWKLFSASYGNNWSLTQDFVNMYLRRDGTRLTDEANYTTLQYADHFDNRDCRLAQTVISPAYIRKISGKESSDAANFAITSTGYQPIKWALDDDSHVGTATSYNSVPVIRYAEVLLNLAEAQAELGSMNETIWNKTIRPLRERAGVNGDIPSVYDPYVAAYFQNQTFDKYILEVRRERGTELIFENMRYDDIMRWKMGELIEKTWTGIYIPAKNTCYDLNNDGIYDLSIVDKEPIAADKVPGVTYVVVGNAFRLSNDNHGNIEYGFGLNRTWEQRKYLRPIPTIALQDNPDLGQNPGW